MNHVELFPYIDTAISGIAVLGLAGVVLRLILACLPPDRLGRRSPAAK